jgi:peptide/nickel transport system substrate-binding protein
LEGEKVKLSKKLAIFSITTAMVAGVAFVAPAQAASKDLAIGVTLDIDKLDPHTSTSFSTVRALGLTYGSLVEVGPKLDIRSGLAASWGFNADSTELRLKLRKGVKFHDGSAFDAEDVKASLNRILDVNTKAAARANIATITSITGSGLSVLIKLSVPNAPILAALDGVNMSMLSSDDIADNKIGKTVNGTGPFKYVSWEPGQSVKLEKNATYWKAPVKLDTVTFRIIPTEASILAALNAGTIQFSVLTSPTVALQVGKNLNLYRTPGLGYVTLQLNARVAPLNKLDVRLAIQCAISRAEVVKTAAAGEAKVIGPITSPAYASDPNDRPCPNVDLAKTKKYLADAGYADGLTIKAIVAPTQYATASGTAQSLKAQLAKAGINLELEILDNATYVTRWLAGDFAAAVANNGGRIDPDTMYTRYFPSTGNLNKVAGYSSATLDALFLKGKATGRAVERKAIYKQVSQELENNAVWIWLFAPYEYRAAAKNVTGFIPLATGSLIELRVVDLK